MFTKNAFKAIDATAKLASELEMSTEALTTYGMAAGLTGVNNDQLGKAIQRMVRNIGEARSGITTGTKALEDFGISLEELEGKTTQAQFETIIDRLSTMEDPLIRSAKAAVIFGKSGQKLINFFKLGTRGIKGINKELEEMGILFTSVDAAKVEAANDAMLRMETLLTGIGNTLAIKVAPVLEAAADKITDFVKEGGGITKMIEDSIVAIVSLVDKVQKLNSVMKKFSPPLQMAEAFIEKVGLIAGSFEDTEARNSVQEFFSEVENGSKNAAEELEKLRKAQAKFDKELRERAERIKKRKEEDEKLSASIKSVVDEAKRIFAETRTPLENINEEIKKTIELSKSQELIYSENLRSGIQRKIDSLKEQRKQIIEDIAKAAKVGETDEQKRRRLITESKQEAAKSFLESAKTQEQRIMEQIEKIEKLFLEGFFKGAEGLAMQGVERLQKDLAEITKRQNQKADELSADTKFQKAGFKEIDLRHIDIAGVDRALTIDRKQLNEQEKQTAILNNINGNLKGGNMGAVAQ
jgi:hypothetical protein